MTLPAAITPGNIDYYRLRNADFVRRHPELAPPAYYLQYGDKYAHRFVERLAPELSPTGRIWVAKTFVLLQTKIEERREQDPEAFDALERDERAFQQFAVDTHSEAYVEGGLAELPIDDLVKIASTPALQDLVSWEGLVEVKQTEISVLFEWVTGKRLHLPHG